MNEFTGEGLLVAKAKESLMDPNLTKNLLSIKRDYEPLIGLVENSEKTRYNMVSAYNDLMEVNFGVDSCNLKLYLNKRLNNNADLKFIATLSRDDISPSQYQLLQNCQASSASVERSFLMLKKLLAKDRPFNDENVQKYFMVYYNSSQEINDD